MSCLQQQIASQKNLKFIPIKAKHHIRTTDYGWFCEGILNGEDIAKTEKAFEKFKVKVDGLLTPEEIRHIRKDILKLTQEEAGKIFGGGKNGFSRYERGETQPLPAISNLLKMLERHPEDLKYIINKNNAAAE